MILVLIASDQVRHAARHRRTAEILPAETPGPQFRFRTIAQFLVLGIVCLPFGARLLIDAAVELAGIIGVSDSATGLTIVATGNSLPELATTTMAVVRRKADVALGNVIGSNVFNLLLIAGGAALFGTIPVPREFLAFDLWFRLAVSLLLAPYVFSGSWEMARRFGVLHHDQATNATIHNQGLHRVIYSCFVPMNRVCMSRRGDYAEFGIIPDMPLTGLCRVRGPRI